MPLKSRLLTDPNVVYWTNKDEEIMYLTSTINAENIRKILFQSDFHLGEDSVYGGVGIGPSELALRDLILRAESEKACLVLSGDILHRAKPSPVAMKVFANSMSLAIAKQVHVFITPGNHDKVSVKTLDSALDAYTPIEGMLKYIHIADYPTLYTVNSGDYVFNIVAIPNMKEKLFIDTLDMIVEAKHYTLETFPTYFSIHQDIIGAQQIGAKGSILSKRGISSDLFTDLKVKYGYSSSAIWKVIAGHYHAFQQLNDMITIIGSALQFNFGERANVPRLGEIDLKNPSLLHIIEGSDYDRFVWEKVNFTVYEFVLDQLRKDIDRAHYKYSIRLTIEGKPEDLNKIDDEKITEEMSKICRTFEIVKEPIVSAVKLSVSTSIASSSLFDKNALLERYIRENYGVDMDEDDIGTAIDLGRSYIHV